mmetsp:Transcript_1171/g.2704  ORF Transcript_1171/g.2704 Transcript_1171/m.2704 type:complete len:104 (+) Transcript_1171:42-353(+)
MTRANNERHVRQRRFLVHGCYRKPAVAVGIPHIKGWRSSTFASSSCSGVCVRIKAALLARDLELRRLRGPVVFARNALVLLWLLVHLGKRFAVSFCMQPKMLS